MLLVGDTMTAFRITVATEDGRITYTTLSTSSSQALIDAINMLDADEVLRLISAVRA